MNWQQLTDATKAVLDRAHYHKPIAGDDATFLERLLRFDPERAELVGPGLDHFTVERGSMGEVLSVPSRTVVIHRVGGSQTYWHPLAAIWAAGDDNE